MSNMVLPGADAVLRERLLGKVDRCGRQGVDRETLEDAVSDALKGRDLDRVLAELRASGEVVKRGKRWIATQRLGLRSGTLQALERGDALIRSGSKGEAGWFVGRKHRKGALDGDLVLFKKAPTTRRKSRSYRLPEAIVVERVQTPRSTLVGTLETDRDRRWLVPYDPKLKTEIEVEGGDELLEDQYVVVEIEAQASGSRGPARARVQRVLGSVEKPGVDVEVVLQHYRIPDHFATSNDVIAIDDHCATVGS